MTLYLTDCDRAGGDRARRALRVRARRQALSGGATTHSDAGVTDIARDLRRARAHGRARHAAAGARRDARGPESMCSTAKRCSSMTVLAPLLERFAKLQGGVRAHHHGARGRIRRAARAPGSRRRSRRSTCCTIAMRIFAGGIRPHLLLPADPEARAGPRRRWWRPPPAAIRASFSAPTARRTSARPRKMPAAAPACSRRTRRIELYAEAFEQAGRLDRLEAFASHFGADFYGLPRHSDTHHLDQGALGAARNPTNSPAARWSPIAAASRSRWRLAPAEPA